MSSTNGVRAWPELVEGHGSRMEECREQAWRVFSDCTASGPTTQGLKTETFSDVLLL